MNVNALVKTIHEYIDQGKYFWAYGLIKQLAPILKPDMLNNTAKKMLEQVKQ